MPSLSTHRPSPRTAIVGSGMAGLAAGWLCRRAGHEVVLYEAQARRGMDAHTLTLDSEAGPGIVDVPLRVMSPHAWPSVLALCEEVGVETFEVDTFAAFTWVGGRTWLRNAKLRVGRRDYPFLGSARFINRDSAAVGLGLAMLMATRDIGPGMTLGELAARSRWPKTFFRGFLLPLLTTICTCDEATLIAWPARELVHLFRQILVGKTLRRMRGGTPALVDALSGGLELRAPERVTAISPAERGVTLRTASGGEDTYDHVIVATQANHVRHFLDGANWAREREVLSRFRYDAGELLVHSDERFMPPRREDWTPLSYLIERDASRSMFTVWVNPVEPSLRGAAPVFQTWNPLFEVHERHLLARVKLQRAVVDGETARAVHELERLHAEPGRRLFFCGSFATVGVPLLESAVRSAVRVAGHLGIAAPWPTAASV